MVNNLHFHPLEVVSRYRDPQLQVAENYAYLCNLRPLNIETFTNFAVYRPIPQNSDLIG